VLRRASQVDAGGGEWGHVAAGVGAWGRRADRADSVVSVVRAAARAEVARLVRGWSDGGGWVSVWAAGCSGVLGVVPVRGLRAWAGVVFLIGRSPGRYR
jgi:hypothetical protein